MVESTPCLDRYTVLGRLGSGAHGVVYQARHERPGSGYSRLVAIKVIRPDVVTPALLERFRDETRMLARIRHGAVVKAGPPVWLRSEAPAPESAQAARPMAAFVMDYAHGLPLSRWTERGAPLPLSVALCVVGRLAEVLHEVHHQLDDGRPLRVVHRDIKPSNLILGPGGDIRILDFDGARADGVGREGRELTVGIGGTPGYLPPERLARVVHDPHDPAGDIYALGIVLHELLLGRMPDRVHGATLVPCGSEDEMSAAMALVGEMTATDPVRRPRYREIVRRCSAIQRRVTSLPFIEWCDGHIPTETPRCDDTLSGVVLVEAPALSAAPAGLRLTQVSGPNPERPAVAMHGGRTLQYVLAAAVLVLLTAWMASWSPDLGNRPSTAIVPSAAPSSATTGAAASSGIASPADLSRAGASPMPERPTQAGPSSSAPPTASAGSLRSSDPPPSGAVWLADVALGARLRGDDRIFPLPRPEIPVGRYWLELGPDGGFSPALDADGGLLIIEVTAGSRAEIVCSRDRRCHLR